MTPRVIGLGQRAAGDDAVGLRVLDRLREHALPEGTQLLEVRDAFELVEYLCAPGRVLLIDAVVGLAPGEIRTIGPEVLEAFEQDLSTHGWTVAKACQLARTLCAEPPIVQIIAVGIPPPERWTHGLSPQVLAAVEPALERVVEALRVSGPQAVRRPSRAD